jgi:2-methylcitrate dehydratase PrpD
MAMPSSTKAICNWMYSTGFKDIPHDVRQMARLALYDGIGCTLACSLLPVAHRMVDFVRVVGGPPECSMIGFPLRTSVLNAALVNGTLSHADEVDAIDDFSTRGSHVLAASMASALTAGQLARTSGQEVTRAVALGYELSKRVHAVAARAQRDTGRASGPFDAGNTMGAAAAAGISLGLPPDRMEVALSLAGHLACGITPFGREANHMAKSFTRGGLGAKNGVTAALMAKVGYDAPLDIFDGPQGFFHSYLGVEGPGPEFLAGLGQEFSIRGLIFKRQSAGGGLQAPRQTLLEIISENGLAADNIAEILVEMRPSDINSYFTSMRHPADCGDALAVAAVYGGMGFREAHQETCYKSPQVRSMREHIKVQARHDWTEEERRLHTVVTVTAKDGRKLRKEADYRRMTEEELDAKFSHLVSLRAGETKAKELARILKRLDTVSNVANVMVQLELPEASIDEV